MRERSGYINAEIFLHILTAEKFQTDEKTNRNLVGF